MTISQLIDTLIELKVSLTTKGHESRYEDTSNRLEQELGIIVDKEHEVYNKYPESDGYSIAEAEATGN